MGEIDHINLHRIAREELVRYEGRRDQACISAHDRVRTAAVQKLLDKLDPQERAVVDECLWAAVRQAISEAAAKSRSRRTVVESPAMADARARGGAQVQRRHTPVTFGQAAAAMERLGLLDTHYIRNKRLRDATREDLLEEARRRRVSAKTAQRWADSYERLAKRVPKGRTVGEVLDDAAVAHHFEVDKVWA